MNIRAFHVLAVSTLLLTACVTQPKPLQGNYPDTTPEMAMQSDSVGTAVRWGGRIVSVEPRADSTCFEMISSRVGTDGRPDAARENSNGRFLACRSGFYDPAVFEQNREVTFIGRIDGYETRRIGEYDYRFPRVAADVVYLWPLRNDVRVAYPLYPTAPHYYGWYGVHPRWGWPGWWW